MNEPLTDEKHKTKLCPVHECPPQFCQTNFLNAWYCEACDEYYLEHVENRPGQITLPGKRVKCFPDELPSIEIPRSLIIFQNNISRIFYNMRENR